MLIRGPQGLLDTVEACWCETLGETFGSEDLVLLQATKQSEPQNIFDSRHLAAWD